MDRAYGEDETRQLALDLGFAPVVPPKRNRVDPWGYDRQLYRTRNEVERLFRRLKAFRRVFPGLTNWTRFSWVSYTSLSLPMHYDSVNRP